MGIDQVAKSSGQKTKVFVTLGPVCQGVGIFGFVVWASVCVSGRRLLKRLQISGCSPVVFTDASGKANSLSHHDRASKLEVQTFKSPHLKCEDKMY